MATHRAILALIALAFACLPLVSKSYHVYLAELAMINVIVAIGLNLLTGNCGQISLCNASFMAVGAYATALLMMRGGLAYAAALPVGTLIAALLGACLGFPARRLSGLYLALVTLGFLEIVQVAIEEFPDLTGGVRGLSVAKPDLLGLSLRSPLTLYYFVFVAMAVALLVGTNIQHSRYGRAFDAVLQNPFAAQALGIPLGRIKLLAFTLAAAYAGFAGGLFVVVVGFIDPTEFGISVSLFQITFIVVGGLGSVLGSTVGAIVLTALPELLRGVKEYSEIVYGALLLAALLFFPKGLTGLLDRWLLRPRQRVARHP
jgi:ABC-type branched-subunit amino acid transport system permease subunit